MLEYIISSDVIIALIESPTIFFLLVGIFMASIGTIIRYLWQTGEQAPTNDRYMPKKAIGNINERHNKYNWQ